MAREARQGKRRGKRRRGSTYVVIERKEGGGGDTVRERLKREGMEGERRDTGRTHLKLAAQQQSHVVCAHARTQHVHVHAHARRLWSSVSPTASRHSTSRPAWANCSSLRRRRRARTETKTSRWATSCRRQLAHPQPAVPFEHDGWCPFRPISVVLLGMAGYHSRAEEPGGLVRVHLLVCLRGACNWRVACVLVE